MDLQDLMRLPPYHRWLGVELVRAGAGEVAVRLPYRPEFQGDEAGNNIHGGIIAALADIAACFAVISAVGHDVPTLDLRLDYLRMAPTGEELTAVGRVLKAGRSIGVADVEVRAGGGRLVAAARGTFMAGAPDRATLSEKAEARRICMRAALIREHGGRDKLLIEDVPKPVAGPGEIVVAVKACGLNHLDIFVRRGMPGLPIELPRIAGGDIAGVVESIGAGVTSVAVGQRVLLDPMITLPGGEVGALGENTTGGLAEFISVPQENAIALPDGVSFIQAAALPIAYGTAWRMMITRGQLKAGEHVLVLGASGGVGTACVQIAHMLGCVVYAGASSEAKLARLQELGADVLINYATHPDFHRHIRSMRGGEGVDVVVDYTGSDTWVKSLKSLNMNGRLLTCGATTGYDPKTDIRYIWRKELNILGSDGWRRQDLVELVEAVRSGRMQAVVDRVLPLEEIREGHRLLEEREVFGKVIITP